MMKTSTYSLRLSIIGLAISSALAGCAGEPLESGVDPFAPMVFKEGTTAMPLNPPNKATIQPFYVSQQTIFKFAVDIDSILIGNDGKILGRFRGPFKPRDLREAVEKNL